MRRGKHASESRCCHPGFGQGAAPGLWQPKSHAALTPQLNIWTWQMFVAELSVGSAPVLFWAGVDMDEYDASQI